MIGAPVSQFSTAADDGVKWWFHQIDRGLRLRKNEEERWEENEKFDDLKQWGGEEGDMEGDSEVTVNKVGSWIRTHRASLAFKNPRVKLTPKGADGWEPIPVPQMGPNGQPALDEMGQVIVKPVQRYKVREQLLNEIISAPLFGFKKTISRLIKASTIGYGVLKVGYRPRFETPNEPDKEQMVKVTAEGLDFSDYMVNPVTQEPITDDEGNLVPKTAIPAWEDWFIDWTHYRHMIIDPDGGNDFMRHSWVAMEIVRPLEDVKADPLLKNTKDLTGSGDFYTMDEHLREADSPTWLDDEDMREKAEQIRLFEVWDLKNDKLIVLADGHGEYLREEAFKPELKYSPFVMYRPNEVIAKCEQFYPRPPVTDLAPIAIEYNKARRQKLLEMKKSNRKIFVKEGGVDIIGMDALTSDEDMAVVKVKVDGNYGMADAIMPFTPPPTNGATDAELHYLARDFDEVAGQPGESRGVASSKTATQVNKMGQYSGVRLDFDRSVLVDALLEALKKLDDSIQANMTVERAVSIVGEDGQVFNGVVDPEMILCDCDLEIDIEDMAPVDSQQQAALKAQFAQIAGQSPWLIADEEVCIGWGKEFGIKDVSFLKKLAGLAQMQVQMMMMQAQPKSPEADAPQNEADAISQTGAGTQAPNMQGAS